MHKQHDIIAVATTTQVAAAITITPTVATISLPHSEHARS